MSSNKIIKIKDFKKENVRFSVPKLNKRGGKVVYINYDFEDGNEPKPLRIQMNKMKLPFGVSSWVDGKGFDTDPTDLTRDSLDFSFSESHKQDVIKLQEFEQLALEYAVQNSFELFKKKRNINDLRVLFDSKIKFSLDKEGNKSLEYQPRLHTNLLKDSSSHYITQIYDKNNQRVEFGIHNFSSVIPKGSDALSIIECSNIWTVNDKFGVSIRPVQMKIFKNETSLTEFAIDESDAGNESDTVSEPLETEETVDETPEVLVRSVEDLDLLGSDSDPDPEPVVSKTVSKRKTKK